MNQEQNVSFTTSSYRLYLCSFHGRKSFWVLRMPMPVSRLVLEWAKEAALSSDTNNFSLICLLWIHVLRVLSPKHLPLHILWIISSELVLKAEFPRICITMAGDAQRRSVHRCCIIHLRYKGKLNIRTLKNKPTDLTWMRWFQMARTGSIRVQGFNWKTQVFV